MKKLSFVLLAVCLVFLLALTLSSCGSKISAPSGLYLDEDTLSLRWNAVKGAKYYTVHVSGVDKEYTTKNNNFSLEFLQPGTYEVRVRANGTEDIGNSGYTKYKEPFVRPVETGLKYELINNGTEYRLIDGGSASGDVVMESVFRGKPVTEIAEKALDRNFKITSFVVGDYVKTIGAKAFTGSNKITSITIPNGVKSIGEAAFQSCKALTEIVLPDSVTYIAPYTFAWCDLLEKVTLGKNTNMIGECAFQNCEALTTITYTDREATPGKAVLPDSMVYIASYAFRECYALADLDVGNGTQDIAPYAFLNNYGLTTLKLGEGLLAIEEAAFAYCYSLTAVAIPDATEYIGNNAFYGCTALADISIGTGLETLGSQAFYGSAVYVDAMENKNRLVIDGWLVQVFDTKVENFSVADVHGIASYAFYGCTAMQSANLKGVRYVGMAAFYGCESLYEVVFDDSLIALGDYAFYGCTYLKKVNVGTKLETVGSYAFYECRTLVADDKNFKLPDTVTYIGTRAFRNSGTYVATAAGKAVYVSGWVVDYIMPATPSTLRLDEGTRGIAAYAFTNQVLWAVTMPADSVEYICRGAFYKAGIPQIMLADSIKVIEEYAFYGCQYTNFGTENYELVIPEGTEYIGRSAFYQCSYIVSLTVPGTVKTIGDFAFYGCSALGATVKVQIEGGEEDAEGEETEEGEEGETYITVTGFLSLGEGIEYIGERAFQGCSYLTDLVIPDSVQSIGVRAFYKCASLTNVSIGEGLTEIADYTFYKCEALTTVTGGENLERIGNYAFRGCAALAEFDLNKVEVIGRYAFYGCASLTEMTFPTTLVEIGDYAFRGCTEIDSFILPDTLETIGKHAFYGLNTTTFYAASEKVLPYWNVRFNSSYRPVIWGCTLSEDGSYVVSFKVEKTTFENPAAKNGISDPVRAGYTFFGWATEAGSKTVAYTSENVAEAPVGTVLYAIWDVQQVEDANKEVIE